MILDAQIIVGLLPIVNNSRIIFKCNSLGFIGLMFSTLVKSFLS